MPPTDALRAVVDWLRCPHCASPLAVAGGQLACDRAHAFDVARQGYVNLLGRAAPRNADTPDMVAAREAFLSRGHYDGVRDAVARAAGDADRLLEVGAGTGWYLAGALERTAATGLATDVSAAACRRAARAHPRAAAVVADTWAGLPLVDGCVDAVLCVFAPRNAAEFARVLRPGGRLVVAVPGPAHLAELRERHGLLGIDDDKVATLTQALSPAFAPAGTQAVTSTMDLADDEATALVDMGPNAFHRAGGTISGGAVTLDVEVATFVRA